MEVANHIVQERVLKSEIKGNDYHDRRVKIREFEVGDVVWARNFCKRGLKVVRAKSHQKISPLPCRVFVCDGLI